MKPAIPTAAHKIRIIGGKHRGRRIMIPDRDGLRPSPDRVRETLFNWLQWEIAGAHVLDAFAGSGALGLEALSRGAASVLFADNDTDGVARLRALLAEWHEAHARVQAGDVFLLSPSAARYDLIFLDPRRGGRGAFSSACCAAIMPTRLPHDAHCHLSGDVRPGHARS